MKHVRQFANKGQSNRVGVPASFRAYNRSLLLLDNNDAEAFRLNSIAADEGMHDAVLAMGWFYLNGVGVEKDEEEAIRWYRKSARQGDPRALFSLGQIAYFRKDYPEALVWFTRAAKKNHYRSIFWIGKMRWRGDGVSRDREIARRCFAQASSKKIPEAQRTMRFLNFLARNERESHEQVPS